MQVKCMKRNLELVKSYSKMLGQMPAGKIRDKMVKMIDRLEKEIQNEQT